MRACFGGREAWCGRVWEGRVPPSLWLLALRPGLLTPLQTTRIPLLLPPLHTLQLKMNEEPLPPKMLLLSRTGTEDQPRTENVNTHAPQAENPTHERTDQ